MQERIVNKVAQSSLETIDLEKFYPGGDTIVFDMKDHLFMELILKEKDYRENLKKMDWSEYKNKNVCITCTADAIIPLWAYMLAVSYLQPLAKDIVVGSETFMHEVLFLRNLAKINVKDFEGKRVVIKGCGDKEIPASVYAEVTKILLPVVQSIMYGEPCSTVPVYKKRN
jgi:Protein of unknown function (DUF2480)